VSLGEIGELYSTLQEIDVMLGRLEVKTSTLRATTVHAIGGLREVEYLFYRLSSLLSRLGLPPEVDDAINKIQRMILMIRILHTTMIFLQTDTTYGLIMGIISGGGAVLSSIDFSNYATRGR
jgi:hypothetical protein